MNTIDRTNQTNSSKNVAAIYPLTPMQQGMLFHTLYKPESTLYFEQLCCTLQGELDAAKFAEAWQQVSDRHAVLRTAFIWENVNKPLQVVGKVVNLPWVHYDWRSLTPTMQQAQFAEFLAADRQRGFMLNQAPLMRFALMRVAEDRYQLVWSYHHLLIDGWSLPTLMQEVFAYYEAAIQGETVTVALPRPYRDYVMWREKQDAASANQFWQTYLEGVTAPTPLPIRLNALDQPSTYQAIEQQLSATITTQLQEFSRHHQLTLNTLFQGAWALLLARYSGESQAVFGATVSGRPPALPGVETMVGLFINTVPVKIAIPSATNILEWLKGIQLQQLETQSYDYSSLVDIQGASAVPRGLPLFETLLVFENYPISESLQEQDISLDVLDIYSIEQTNYPLTLVVIPSKELTIQANYDASQFDKSTIDRLLGHFQNLLQGIVKHPDGLIDQLSLLTPAEVVELDLWQQPSLPPNKLCLHQAFEQQVALYPEQSAVAYGDHNLSYEALNQQANQLAHYLQSLGVGSEILVGICMEQSIDLIVCMLAIIKAGGAYVPLDPSYPVDRLALILKDTQLSILLTTTELLPQLPVTTAQTVCVDGDQHLWNNAPICNLNPSVSPSSLAYIIYTSGSTGMPKGVMIPQQGITRLVLDTNYVMLTADDRIAQASNTAFDAATFEIWGALLNGAQIVVIPRSTLLSPPNLAAMLQEQQITVLFLTTALFNQIASLFPTAFAQLRCLLMGGEVIDPAAVRVILKAGAPQQLIHVYGPTESTTFTSWYQVTEVPTQATTIPIGRPVAQTEIYILDRNLCPVPVGIPGELHIGGNGLARGYWQRPELTAEKFISHPWCNTENACLYKTGDLVRYLSSGDIEYLGRLDQQVKIRGFRVELGEIEAVLSQHLNILQVSVQVLTNDLGHKQLVAYVVMIDNKEIRPNDVKAFLANRLPDYMIPVIFVPLQELPLTLNGKIDRRALPVPDLAESIAANYVAPRTELEKTLAAIWAEVLGVAQVGIFDNFFELGGHSLIATQLISRIRSTCKVEVSLHTLFTFPTITALAVEIDQTSTPQQTWPLVPIDRSASNQRLPLSYAQQRLWFLQQVDQQSTAYHIPGALRLQGKLEVSALQQSLQSIVHRHESLRTNFAIDHDGQPHQIIQSITPVSLPVIDLQQLSDTEQSIAIQKQIAIVNDGIFDLTIDPLLRTRLLQLGVEEYLLLFCMHHIISDGWSMGVIVQELAACYTAAHQGQTAILPPLTIQYADFAHWQRQLLAGELRQQQLHYWQTQLANLAPCLELPTDRPRPAMQTYHGAVLEFSLNASLSSALEKLSQQTGSTLFMTLLAAFQILLARYTGQTDIAVGSPIANRNRQEIEHLIGFFVNTLVLRTDLAGQPTFRELLQRVRLTTLAAYDHQDLPFEIVVEALQPARNLSHSPLFQIMFVLQNAPAAELHLPDLILSSEVTPSNIAKFDLTLALAEPDKTEPSNGLTGAWEYNTDLFDSGTIARMSDHFQQLLTAIVHNPDSPIAQLSIVSPSELAQLMLGSQGDQRPVATDRCIHQLIAAEAIAHPQATAVVWGDQALTYAELDARANQLAHYLQSLGVQTESIVGICVERSLELIVGLLGILKADAAYVPIDPSYPPARVAAILTDTQMPVLLTQAALVAQLPESQTPVICLDADWPQIATQSSDSCVTVTTAEQLAYVVYTSGSTGIPKGVMIPHAGLLNLVAWHRQAFEVTAADRATQLAGIAFDAAGWEIWPYLAAGATLHLVPPDLIYQPADLRDWLLDHEITLSFVPTPVAEQLFNLNWPASNTLRMMLVGGDRLVTNPAGRVPFQVVNNYGPTENSVVTTSIVLAAKDSDLVPTIGRPISNTQVYCLDAQGQIAPWGVPGELWLGGDSLARGYLNRPELTAQAFIHHPELAGARLYRSGDRGRYLANGQIEYLGRMDQQVKIRGFRIEPGEIETVLNQHPGLLQAVVIAHQPELETMLVAAQLVAYIVPSADTSPTVAQLRQFLADRLPDYMIPAHFISLAVLPLTANGKVDRRALPVPDLTAVMGENYVAPQTAIETQLTQIWSAVLGLNQVGIHDNFFAIGGDSILSLQIVARAGQAGIQITPKQLFSHQSIAELAAVAQMGASVIAEQGMVIGEVPLTPIQQWYFEQNWPEPQHFNQTVLLQIPASVLATSLQTVLAAIFYHHDTLRLKFVFSEDRWQQTHADLAALPQLQVIDLGNLSGTAQTDRLTEICSQHQASFDLAAGCLLKATLFQMGVDQPQRLLLAVHHLAVDGVSWRILLDDIQTAFQQVIAGETISLPAKTTAWQQWAQQLTIGTDLFVAELDYWQRQVLSQSLPTDRVGENTVCSTATVSVGLSSSATQDLLQKVPTAYRTQINDVLIAALAQTIGDWIGATKIPLTLEGHGREALFEDIDISRTVGWFTTMFPVCLDLATGQEPDALLKTIKEQLRAIPHKGIGYGLLRYVCQEPSLADTLSAPLSFNYLGQFDQILNPDSDFQIAQESAGADISLQSQRQHLLDVNGLIVGGELQLNWTYSENLYDRQTIDQLAHNCLNNLMAIIAHCVQPDVGGYTPSDFPLAPLQQEQLDNLVGNNWREVVDIYPLSPMQQGMLFHSLYDPAAGVYVVQLTGTLQGALDSQVFTQAWQQVIDRYEVFRTSYWWVDVATPLQVIHRRADLPLICQDWRDRNLPDQPLALADLMEFDRQQGFDLGQAPLMRLHLIQLAEDRHYFIWSHHHLLLDGWSLPIVLQTVFNNYDAISHGLTPALAPPPTYQTYIAWLQQQNPQQAADFWQRELAGLSAPTVLPTHKSNLTGYGEVQRTMSKDLTTALQNYARQQQLTINTIVQGAWALLLSLYSSEQEVLFGATVAGRPPALPNVETMVGLFINTLPVRVKISDTAKVTDWLQSLQDQHQERDRYAYTSLVDIQGWSDIPRGIALFDSIIVFENYPVQEAVQEQPSDLKILEISGNEQTNFPLTVTVIPSQSLTLRLSYDRSCFTSETISQIGDRFHQILTAIVAQPTQSLASLTLLSAGEQAVITQFQQGAEHARSPLYFHQLFEAQVARTPQATALVFKEQALTYQALNDKANQLARHLQSLGVGPEVLVGISLERNLDLVVGLLGILKAGGAYVPLDPSYPSERLAYMVVDAQLSVLLTQTSLVDQLPSLTAQVVQIDADWSQIATKPSHNLERMVQGDHLAYVIYTSGSTGQPKGVQIPQSSVSNFLQAVQRVIGMTDRDVCLAVTTISFDIAVLELYLPLITGAQILLASRDVASDGQQLSRLLAESEATVMQATPATWQMLIAAGWPGATNLKILCGGEALSVSLAEQLLDRSCTLWNMYGPTEATVWATTYQVLPETIDYQPIKIPIGKPMANIQTYILDDHLQPVPIGIRGELYIGGDCLARGYLNRPELTGEKFIAHPFSKESNARLYKTGDAVRYLPTGEIEYLDRLDNQVKLRGFRIELGEIEAVLLQHPEIQQAVAIIQATELNGISQQQLIAYVVARDLNPPTGDELCQFLAQHLPPFMIPSFLIPLAHLPLMPNGKVDRRALPIPESSLVNSQYEAPQTSLEIQLADLWTEILGVSLVSRTDNFFVLGGHSLLATQLLGRIRTSLQVEISLRELFTASSLAALAEVITTTKSVVVTNSEPPLVQITDSRALPLSYAQQRMWFLHQLDPHSATYHMPGALRLQGQLVVTALTQSLQQIGQRQASLRTTFPCPTPGEPIQLIAATVEIPLPCIDLQQLTAAEQSQEIDRLTQEVHHNPFDLTQDGLLRVQLLQLATDDYLLLFCMHHIISDGWSIEILTRELAEFYAAAISGQAAQLPELTIQYSDFAQWQRQVLSGDIGAQQLHYWQTQLADLPPLLELPTDRPRPPIQTFIGSQHAWQLEQKISAQLEQFSQQAGATLFMTLLAAFQVLLYRYSGQTDVAVGSPIANRNRPEIANLLGFFVNTLVLRTDLSGQPTFREVLAQVRETTLSAYEHQDLPFELVVEALQPERDLSHTPLFQVMLVLQNNPARELALPGVRLDAVPPASSIAKFDITLNLMQTEHGLEGIWEYNTDLFETATIARLGDHFQQLLKAIVNHGDCPINQLPLMSDPERAQLAQWQQASGYTPSVLCLPELLEQQVASQSEAIAVIDGDRTITYGELNARANQLAFYLQTLGVTTEVLVGLCMERSIDLIVSVVAILKAGGVYVPLDPTYPPERLAYMLDDTQLAVLLTQEESCDRLPPTSAKVITVHQDWAQIASHPTTNFPTPSLTAENLAYIIYTSGSTGQPKGVMVTHGGITRLVLNTNYIQLSATDRVAQAANTAFDAATFEIWGALLNGAQLVVVPQAVLLSPPDLITLLAKRQISILFLTPAFFNQLASITPGAFSQLRYLIMGGEALDPHWVRQVFAAGAPQHLLNGYGPTESTTFATYYEVTDLSATATTIPIGRPLAHTEILILDSDLQPVPIGVPGELHIGGAGLARGYWQQPELTAAKFIPHPRREGRLYKTGDLVRYLPNGDIDYLDRIDQQVKVRGFRVEIGEIEAVLSQHPEIRQAVVVVQTITTGQKQLIAYIVICNPLSTPDLRQFLATRLPDYMIPLAFISLDELPLNPNGKVDKRALPVPDLTSLLVTEYVAPETELEVQIAEIWVNLLGLTQVGITDNFFDLGGHSLLVTQFISRVHHHYQVALPLQDFFMRPTIRDAAQIILETQLSNITEEDFLAQTLAELEELSDEDVQKLLDQDDTH
jgi:amino acid adenylation domain-containing protein/non-ribosomal peptide synthase protein (TIGR01720 family)